MTKACMTSPRARRIREGVRRALRHIITHQDDHDRAFSYESLGAIMHNCLAVTLTGL